MSPPPRTGTAPRAWHSEERARLIIDAIQDYAIVLLDPLGRVESWNPGAERLLGYPEAEIVGQPASRFYLPEEAAQGRPEVELKVAAEAGRFEDEGWRVRRDGSRFWANVVVTPIADARGHLEGFAKITRDLTERRRAEEARLGQARAEESVRLRDEFLSIAAHELKTPLTALRLQLEALRRRLGADERDTAVQVRRADRSAERLAVLVEELLDVARLSTGRFSFRPAPFELGAAVAEVVDRFREAAAQAGCTLELTVAEPVEGRWDRLRLEQVVTNLLANALRYGAGAPLAIGVARDGDGAAAELTVADHGPGVPPEARTRIFGRFERASSPRSYGGLGLGLYLVAEIVKGHGGTVAVDDAPGGGARFTVRLPIAEG